MTKLSKILLVVIFLLAFITLFITNTFTTHGQLITDLEEDIIQLRHQNLRLELELAQATALTNLAPKLEVNNFQVPKQVTGLTQSSASVAMR